MSSLHTANNLWWMTPLQAFAAIGAAVNFGGSALHTPLVMPMLQIPTVPTQYAAKQTAYLLHASEMFFPPANAACTLANLVLTITAFLNRDTNRTAAAKLPFLATATGLSLATTAYALGIMVPINQQLVAYGKKLDVDANDKSAESGFREIQAKWKKLNLGRAMFMISSAVVSVYALVLDGSVVRI
nr:hypothetical protein CFP56_43750 [Quercus suber]